MVDFSKVRAIDFHTHAEESCGCHADDGYDELQSTMAKYFGAPWSHPPTIPETAAHYREMNIAAVIFPVDAERETGYRRYNNYEVAEACAKEDDILIPFASIDPHKGKLGAREARDLVANYGVQGFKFHPTMQGFYPNDRMAYDLYEAIAETGKPALFHTGQTGVGSGMKGGNGMRLKYSNPMYIDDLAVDFPDMPIILAHPSFPWQEEALSVATHKPNVYIDLSGWSPKYFPEILIRYSNTLLKKKMLFGSDWPMIAPEKWLDAFDKQNFKDEVRPLILKENAMRLLGGDGVMVPFAAPVDDILFSLRKVADVDRLPDWDDELAEGVITHFASFAEGVIAPLDESGDAQGCRLENGRVRMPDGFGDAYSQLAEGGWQGLTAPEQFGGMQADHVTAACVSEIFSGANHSMQMVCNLVPGAISTLMRFGTEDQKSAYIPPLAEGRWLATMCLTEPGAGSDLGRVRTKAVQDGDHYKITGEKIFISGGDQDMSEGIFHLVLARTGAMEDGVKGLSLFLCLSENDGIRNDITVTRIEEKLGLHASPTCQMSFDGARAELVGAEGQGLMAMFTMMNHARIDVSLQGVAHASRAYQVASTYAADRTQGRKSDGSPAVLSDHPDVCRMLDEQRMLALGARAMVHVAMVEMDLDARPALVDFLTPVCKVFCTDAGTRSADLGMQILGGYGYLTEYRVSQTWRDARICSIYEGANGIHDLTIATRGLKLPGAADGFDDLIGELTDDAAVLAIRDTWRAMRAEVAASATPAEMAYDFARLTGELYFRAVWAKMAKVGDDEMQRLFARVQRRPLPVLV